MKKPPSKVAHNRPPAFFYVLARLPKWPKNRNPVQPKAPYCSTGYLDWVYQEDCIGQQIENGPDNPFFSENLNFRNIKILIQLHETFGLFLPSPITLKIIYCK